MDNTEIDKMVAEKIMGNKPKWKNCPCLRCEPDNYSTDIKASFEVLGKLIEEGWSSTLYMNPTTSMNGCVLIKIPENCNHLHPSVALPMAICLAALKTKGIEVG